MPIAAISSSAWTIAKRVLAGLGIDAEVCGSSLLKASATEVDGVIGYQAQTVAPP